MAKLCSGRAPRLSSLPAASRETRTGGRVFCAAGLLAADQVVMADGAMPRMMMGLHPAGVGRLNRAHFDELRRARIPRQRRPRRGSGDQKGEDDASHGRPPNDWAVGSPPWSHSLATLRRRTIDGLPIG